WQEMDVKERFPNVHINGGTLRKPEIEENRIEILSASTRSNLVAEEQEEQAIKDWKQFVYEQSRAETIPYTQMAPNLEQPTLQAETKKPTFVNMQTPGTAIPVLTNGEYVVLPPFTPEVRKFHPDLTSISVNTKTNEVMLTSSAFQNGARICTLNLRDPSRNHDNVVKGAISAGIMPSGAKEIAEVVDSLVNQKINTGSYAIQTQQGSS
ncbi:MAG: hypothetical protein ACREAS_02775, partial [Nitrososphaera sp.]